MHGTQAGDDGGRPAALCAVGGGTPSELGSSALVLADFWLKLRPEVAECWHRISLVQASFWPGATPIAATYWSCIGLAWARAGFVLA